MTEFVSVRGNILNSQARVLVNPVNCVGVMGAGLAKQFAAAFPEALEPYRRECRGGQLRPGIVRLHPLNTGQFMAAFPTKDHWRQPSRLEYVTRGLDDLCRLMALELEYEGDLRLESIAMPPIGCGLGGLEWRDVRTEIVRRLELPGLTVELYEP